MSNVWFTSDLHLGHTGTAVRFRNFPDVHSHDGEILYTLSQYVKSRDTLWVLGDLSFTKEGVDSILQVATRGRLRFVRGNHDVYPTALYNDVFSEIHGMVKYKGMWLTHCPIHPQELFGKINMHGHIHKDCATVNLGYPYINVNWDFWERPVNLEEIKQMIKNEEVVYDKP